MTSNLLPFKDFQLSLSPFSCIHEFCLLKSEHMVDLICVVGKLRDIWMNKEPIKWNASLTAEYDLTKDMVFLCGPG